LIESQDGPTYANLSASGSLWKDALILRDDVSHSLWSQLEGWAVRGSQEGAQLETYPFERTTWGAWKSRHPDTQVLFKPTDSRRAHSVYASYFSDDEALGIFGTDNPDDRLPGKELVIGVRHAGATVAVPLAELKRAGGVAFELDDGQAICVWDGVTEAARCFRTAGTEPFSIETGDAAIVTRGESRWQLDGRPLGESRAPLQQLDATPVFWFAWAAAYPATRVERP
jgi:hypothetical protein